MSRSWVKLSTSILDHFDLDAVDPGAFKVFIKCLALAGSVDDDGRLGKASEVAYRLRIPMDDLRCAVESLGGRIRDAEGELWVRDWSEHQPTARRPEPPEQVTERWRRWSARQREPYESPTGSLDEGQTPGSVNPRSSLAPIPLAGDDQPTHASATSQRSPNDALEERREDTEGEQEEKPPPTRDASASRGSRNGSHADCCARERHVPDHEDPLKAHAEAFGEAFHLNPFTAVQAKRTLIWAHARRCVDAGATVAEWANWVAGKSRERTSDRRMVWGTIVKAHNATETFLCERDARRGDRRPRDSEGEFAEFVMR